MDANGNGEDLSRRSFLRNTAGSLALSLAGGMMTARPAFEMGINPIFTMATEKSLIGAYGPWAASLLPTIPSLSLRHQKWTNVDDWRKHAVEKTTELVAAPPKPGVPKVTIHKKYTYDGLEIEELSWQLPYGRPTQAVLLKPVGVTQPLPGILGLHDHAGMKYFGLRKIVKTSDEQLPILREHQKTDYGGRAWANELAKLGYVVLVHDAFAFGSRRVHYEDTAGLNWGAVSTEGKSDADPENEANIRTYNEWSSEHEHVMAKSLFSAGTTWPGVFLMEDQVALDVLASRKEVDPARLGCGGLSGGGLRTVYLGGLDPRVKCAVCVGFMTTWNDLILNKSFNHTWMTYTPLLPQYLDFPEVLGLRAPLPTLVLNNNHDELYTLTEMKKADAILSEVFKKAGAPERYKASFYDGPHKFDAGMQQEAFAWFKKWL